MDYSKPNFIQFKYKNTINIIDVFNIRTVTVTDRFLYIYYKNIKEPRYFELNRDELDNMKHHFIGLLNASQIINPQDKPIKL